MNKLFRFFTWVFVLVLMFLPTLAFALVMSYVGWPGEIWQELATATIAILWIVVQVGFIKFFAAFVFWLRACFTNPPSTRYS